MDYKPLTTIFKDYDIRGTYPKELNAEVFSRIANALTRHFHPKTVAIVRDMRTSGEELRNALVQTFTSLGIDVYDAGLAGTEVAYFLAGTAPYDLVLMISASHNPKEYNGLKVLQKGPVAITGESGLFSVRDLLAQGPLTDAPKKGTFTAIDPYPAWREKILSLIDTHALLPLSVVVDAGNGMGGVLVSKVFEGLPLRVTGLYMEPDGTFPHHVPNPLVPENNADLIAKITEIGADVGIAFDGDADRMFLIDDRGRFVRGTITTAILARYFLEKFPGSLILYNAICGRVVPELVEKLGGKSKRVRVGHSFIKTFMRETGAVFAGEHSGHYYYKDFFNAESGVLSALLVLSLLSSQKKKLSELVRELDIYPAIDEMNFTIGDVPGLLEKLKTQYSGALSVDELDGLSVWYKEYWFNVRASKTEPLVRLNLEANTKEILEKETEELVSFIQPYATT